MLKGYGTGRLRLRVPVLALLAVAIAGFGPPHPSRAARSELSGASQWSTRVVYQPHMVFFSHEAGLSTIIDPQMFVSAPGTPAGTGPQGIVHVANFTPAPAADPPATVLYNADGQDLGLTLGEWEAAQGRGMLRCGGDGATAVSHFQHLVPRGVYSLFVVHFAVQGSGRFTPLGAADGSNNSFVANPAGQGHERSLVTPCLTSGSEGVVLVWHSDDQTHGASLGSPGVTSHNQLIFRVP